MFEIEHFRTQHSVGHGFFHSSEIRLSSTHGSGAVFRYVYDCGGQGPREGALAEAVERYVTWADAEPINVVFVSHLHTDHVSGLENLLGLVKAEHVVLPYLFPIERLSIYADGLIRNDVGDVDLIVNPAERLRSWGAETVTFVSGRGKAGLDEKEDEAEGNIEDLFVDHNKSQLELEFPWDESNNTEAHNVVGGESLKGFEATRTRTMGHDRVSRVKSGNTTVWNLLTYVRSPLRFLERFAAKLRQVLPEQAGILLAVGSDVDEVSRVMRSLIANRKHRKLLRAAYETAEPGTSLNRTSMSLASVPANWLDTGRSKVNLEMFSTSFVPKVPFRNDDYPMRRVCFGDCPLCDLSPFLRLRKSSVGWLGTGDAELNDASEVSAFLRHFGQTLHKVDTMVLPHHGSEHNYHPRLRQAVRPNIALVSAKSGDEKHPDPNVVADVSSEGAAFFAVTEETSAFQQGIRFRVRR